MATSTSINVSNFALELGGQMATWLRSVQVPTLELLPADKPLKSRRWRLGDCSATFNPSEADALFDWMQGVWRRKEVQAQDGAVVFTDASFKPKRRIDFTGALLTGISISALEAASRDAVEVQLSWKPTTVAFKKVTDSANLPSGGRRKLWVRSNFRVIGLPFAAANVARVELPSLKAEVLPGVGRKPPTYGKVELGELAVTVSARGEDELRDWVNLVVADGKLGASELLDLSVELLDASLKKTLATVKLSACGLLRVSEPPRHAGDTALRSFTLAFAVEAMDIEVTPPPA